MPPVPLLLLYSATAPPLLLLPTGGGGGGPPGGMGGRMGLSGALSDEKWSLRRFARRLCVLS